MQRTWTVLKEELQPQEWKHYAQGYNCCSMIIMIFIRNRCVSVSTEGFRFLSRKRMSFSLFTISGILWCFKIWCLLSACLKSKRFINIDLGEGNIGSWQLQESVMAALPIFKVLLNIYFTVRKWEAFIFKEICRQKKKWILKYHKHLISMFSYADLCEMYVLALCIYFSALMHL